jgi:multiple sugar transport system substrate-binding protein
MRKREATLVSCVLLLVLTMSSVVFAKDVVQLTVAIRSNQTEVAWTERLIEEFTAKHPYIEIELIVGGTGNPYLEKLSTLVAGGQMPDIFQGFQNKAGFILDGWARDLTEFVERDKDELDIDDYMPGVWESFIRDGRCYGIPFSMTCQLMYYNKDLFYEQGLAMLPVSWDGQDWTWKQMLEYASKLTLIDQDGNYKRVALGSTGESKLPDVCWMFGGDWFTEAAYETGLTTTSTLTRPENVSAYQAVQDLYKQYAAAGPPKGVGSFHGEGRAMEWMGWWVFDSYSTLSFEWALAPLPLVENRHNTRWTNPLIMGSQTEHPEEAWEFLKYATSKEAQQLYAEIVTKVPVRASAMDTFVASVSNMNNLSMDPAEIMTVLGGAIVHSRPSVEERLLGGGQIETFMMSALGPLLRNEVAVPVALETIQKELNVLLASISGKAQK